MSNESLRRIILTTLEAWSKLDDCHKGVDYEQSVKRLQLWLNDLLDHASKA